MEQKKSLKVFLRTKNSYAANILDQKHFFYPNIYLYHFFYKTFFIFFFLIKFFVWAKNFLAIIILDSNIQISPRKNLWQTRVAATVCSEYSNYQLWFISLQEGLRLEFIVLLDLNRDFQDWIGGSKRFVILELQQNLIMYVNL